MIRFKQFNSDGYLRIEIILELIDAVNNIQLKQQLSNRDGIILKWIYADLKTADSFKFKLLRNSAQEVKFIARRKTLKL